MIIRRPDEDAGDVICRALDANPFVPFDAVMAAICFGPGHHCPNCKIVTTGDLDALTCAATVTAGEPKAARVGR